jgi:hypothetical protein
MIHLKLSQKYLDIVARFQQQTNFYFGNGLGNGLGNSLGLSATCVIY